MEHLPIWIWLFMVSFSRPVRTIFFLFTNDVSWIFSLISLDSATNPGLFWSSKFLPMILPIKAAYFMKIQPHSTTSKCVEYKISKISFISIFRYLGINQERKLKLLISDSKSVNAGKFQDFFWNTKIRYCWNW